MTPRRWQQIQALYQSVLQCDPSRRTAFLNEVCVGDDELLRELEALLDSPVTDTSEDSVLDLTAKIAPIPTERRRIGPYEITAPLGSGGMGDVFRARDTKLGREVAIRVLSRALAGDPAHLARFRREAQMLAALNHPNIATIYGLEELEGSSWLVMELVACRRSGPRGFVYPQSRSCGFSPP